MLLDSSAVAHLVSHFRSSSDHHHQTNVSLMTQCQLCNSCPTVPAARERAQLQAPRFSWWHGVSGSEHVHSLQ